MIIHTIIFHLSILCTFAERNKIGKERRKEKRMKQIENKIKVYKRKYKGNWNRNERE